MKRVYIGLALLVVAALVVIVLISRRERPMHVGKGTVLSVDAGGGQVTMKDEESGNLVLVLTQDTKVLDDEENPVTAAKLKAGDLVREECVLVGSNRCQAKQIRIMQPAEKATANPEQ